MSDHCAQCGMPCSTNDYHPFAACLMFMQCHDSKIVEANLNAVIEYGRSQTKDNHVSFPGDPCGHDSPGQDYG